MYIIRRLGVQYISFNRGFGVLGFSVIQMLWANLIMDILGAIALGTEKYQKDIPFQRVSRDQ